jgi:hypothetical protein
VRFEAVPEVQPPDGSAERRFLMNDQGTRRGKSASAPTSASQPESSNPDDTALRDALQLDDREMDASGLVVDVKIKGGESSRSTSTRR